MRLLVAMVALLVAGATAAPACGPDSDCMVGSRSYRIAVPQIMSMGAQTPAIVFVHGYKGKAEGVMRNGALRRLAEDFGAALIAVQSDGPGWEVPGNPRNPGTDGMAELAYFDAVLADAVPRFALDAGRIAATGFSSGGMMIWNLACARPQAYAGFVPVAGTFWQAPPETCAGPAASIVHVHGDADRTVPLTGRAIGTVKQGEVAAALEMYGVFGGFGPAQARRHGGLACRERRNAAGAILDFCLFEGGHSLRTEHLRHALGRLREAGRF